MPSNPFIGRRESVGVSLEATSGTAAASVQTWQPHLSLTLDQKTNTVENNSALGRYETVNDSVIAEQWAEGSLNGKVYSKSIGYFLYNMFGAISSANHSGETTVKDHTFTILQSGSVPSLTFTRVNPVETRQYAYGMLTDLEIEIKTGDWVKFTATFQTKAGATTTATAAYDSSEAEFSGKDSTVKFATNLAGLTGATATDITSLKVKLSRKLERNTPLGAVDPNAFDANSYTLTGTIVGRYTDTTLKAISLANTAQAMSVTISNAAVTIGTASHPGLVLTMPKVRLEPVTLSNGLDQVMTQTYNFAAQLDQTSGYMVQGVLTNTQTSYVGA